VTLTAGGRPVRRGVAGAVLCGGNSRRMGTDKAQLQLHGRALAGRVADALAGAGIDRVVAVGGDAGALRGLGLEVVADRYPGEGPLGGVLTALTTLAAGFDHVAILACDLVQPDAATIRAVVAHAVAEDVDVAAPLVDGWRHLHHAVWHVRARVALEEAYDRGERAPRRAIAGLRVGDVLGIDPASVRDADDPDELAAARASLEARPRE
jgi:molybdopterin-guanine dinucleotide biosynthesis protein A